MKLFTRKDLIMAYFFEEYDSFSSTLADVDIQLIDNFGKIKSMEVILNEISQKWQELLEKNKKKVIKREKVYIIKNFSLYNQLYY